MSHTFWSDRTLEPKRKYRFLLHLDDWNSYFVKSVTKPGWEVTETEHKFLNHTFYFPARVQWNEVTVTIVDPVTPDAAKTLRDLVEASGYITPDTNVHSERTQTLSKAKATNSMGTVRIKQLGPENQEVEEWSLRNAWLKNVDFGELTYDDEGMTEITLTIRYDWAELTKSGPGSFIPGDQGALG